MKRGFNTLLVLLVAILAALLQILGRDLPTGRDLLRNYKRSRITTEEVKELLVQESRKHFGPENPFFRMGPRFLAKWRS